MASHRRLFVLTGAGISTASGIPDYRDDSGEWKHQKPMDYRDFIASNVARQRYWSRSYFGWQRFSQASPNAAHNAIARLERLDGLHVVLEVGRDDPHGLTAAPADPDVHGDPLPQQRERTGDEGQEDRGVVVGRLLVAHADAAAHAPTQQTQSKT